MAQKLIIVESPAKARTVAKILGSGFSVKASVGHVRDLPKNTLGVDEENGFEPQYEVLPDKGKIVAELRKAAKKAEEVYLATDPDREGEAIGWHLVEVLKSCGTPIQRVEFHEITKRAVIESFESPRELDIHRVDAQQARRVIDRLVGYRLSPLLWDKVKRGLSAGRVQSVALKMICDREAEIEAFNPEEYWLVDAKVESQTPPPFVLKLTKRAGRKWRPENEEEARAVEIVLRNETLQITNLTKKISQQRPKAPFITAHLQQEAARRLRMPVRRVMQLAQRLYEGIEVGSQGQIGLITYIRTDSVRVSDESIDAAREMIESRWGADALPQKPNFYKNRRASQDAHEAIRPADVTLTPERLAKHLKEDELRLYRLIWERFVASQMTPAKFDTTQVEVVASDYTFGVTGKILKDPGFLRLWKEPEANGQGNDQGNGKGNGKTESSLLPSDLAEGTQLKCNDIALEQKFTQPPARFSEATLVRALEENGIGRPSTYASILATLSSRDYVQRQRGTFHPSHLGRVVSRLLVTSFADLINETYTATLETELDSVAEGSENWRELIAKFAKRFNNELETAKTEMEQVKGKGVETSEKCTECGKSMVIKFGRYGEFLACSGYPECRHTRDLKEETAEEEKAAEGEAPKCPDCESEMVQKRSRFGPFWACSTYPECKGTRRIGGGPAASKPENTGVKCPKEKCDGEILKRTSRRGRIFYGCSAYPKCDFTMWDPPVEGSCPECGLAVLGLKVTKRRGRELVCPVKECSHREPAPPEEDSETESAD
ncbi:MAG: type I DNA topoisomerase [bacterium]|nr:type I DNA topoisomerase [bacterium]